MAISPRFLSLNPKFDTVFGKGYGEEVDWCQKIRTLNGRHLGIASLFVEHRGGSSFGSDAKQALIARNNQIVSRRYPTYDRSVQDFIAIDPLQGPRLALALAWAGTVAPSEGIEIYLAHSLGGGAENWLQAQIAARTEQGSAAVVLRVGGNMRWQVEVCAPDGVTAGQIEDFALVEQLLAPLTHRTIIYSCGVGDSDPVEIPEYLLRLKQGPQDRIEVLFHDFFPISPSFTLLDSDKKFRGIPPHNDTNAAHTTLRPDNSTLDLRSWQAAWGDLIQNADKIVTFSASSADILRGVWAGVDDRTCIRPHHMALRQQQPSYPRPKNRTLAVLGNIAPHKGAEIVCGLASLSDEERGGRMVLIGNIDPTYSLHHNCTVHGNYTPQDIPALIAHYQITHWLIPSIWPETFSFTTHEALATGLPVLAFDIGAQGDAVGAAANGRAQTYDPDGDQIAAVIAAFKDDGGVSQ